MSVEDAVMPTAVLMAQHTAIVLPVLLVFRRVLLRSTSVTAMSKLCELVSVPSEACTVTVYLWLGAVLSKSILVGSRSEERRVGKECMKRWPEVSQDSE